MLQGGQPRGMQCSFVSEACKLSDMTQRDNGQYVLFVCPGLDTVCSRAWDSILRSMPDPLVVELRNSNIKTKCEIILLGLKFRFVREWTEIYLNIGNFCHDIYSKRKSLYDDIEQSQFSSVQLITGRRLRGLPLSPDLRRSMRLIDHMGLSYDRIGRGGLSSACPIDA